MEEPTKLEKLKAALKCTEKVKACLAEIHGLEHEMDAILLNSYNEESIYDEINYDCEYFLDEDIYDLPEMMDQLSNEITKQINKEEIKQYYDKAAKYIYAAAQKECNYCYIVWIKDFYRLSNAIGLSSITEDEFIAAMDKRLKEMK